jgi:predicted Fe-Mo cluster-binding NifX family protein
MAVAAWTDRISPLFDVARHLLVIDIEDGLEVNRREETINAAEVAERTRYLVALGINVLICGAISRPMEDMLISSDIKVIPHTCGPAKNVIKAFLRGPFNHRAFLVPGSDRRRDSVRTDRGGE